VQLLNSFPPCRMQAFHFPSRLHFSNFLSSCQPTFDNKTSGHPENLRSRKSFYQFLCNKCNVTHFTHPQILLLLRPSSSFSSSSYSPFRLQSSCVEIAPAVSATRGAPSVRGSKSTEYRICVDSFEMNHIHVAEGSILRDVEVTSLIIIGAQLSNSGGPPTWHLPHCFEGFNPSNAELNPICHLLALLWAHHIFHVSRIMVKALA
jgi:hypothetical protein